MGACCIPWAGMSHGVAVPGREEWPPRAAAVRTRLWRMVCAPAADPTVVFFPHKNFISHFLVDLLIIAGFANNVPFNLSQPSILFKGMKCNSWRLLTTYRNPAISLRPITAQMLYMPVPRVPACMNHTEQSCWRCKGCCAPQPAKQDSGLKEVEAFPEAFLGIQLGLAGEEGICWCETRGCDGRWLGSNEAGQCWQLRLSWSATGDPRRWSAREHWLCVTNTL